MVSKAKMIGAIPRAKLAAAVKKMKIKVPRSWSRKKIAAKLSMKELTRLYNEAMAKMKKPVKKKAGKKKPAARKKKVTKKKSIARRIKRFF